MLDYIVNLCVKRVIFLRCIALHCTYTLIIPRPIEQGCKHIVMFLLQLWIYFKSLIYSVYMLNFIHGGKIYCAIDHVCNTEWEICRSMIERRNIT